jgi:glutamate-ammonia-ligase adenylyltransferase
MSAGFASCLRSVPLPHDPGPADAITRAFADIPSDVRELLAGTAGCSPYLFGLMEREADWLRAAITQSPDETIGSLIAGLETEPDDLSVVLRQAKRRVALITALADLGGLWTLEQVTRALTDFADKAVGLAVTSLVAQEIRRGKLPGQSLDDLPSAAGMVVLAMGKMGAGELNYSSDIDLICLFDDDRYGADSADARAAFVRVTRRMAALLSDKTDEGYVFRTDLRLRPDASVTPVCLSMTAAETYYESEGRTWERAAYIKARPCAGDLAAGQRFLAALTPFVWRKHLDFAAIQDAHDMRLRIRDHRGLHGRIVLEGHNMKLGAGGIREIEFFTQTRQLIAGGRDPSLRDPTTVGGLDALAERGWIPRDTAENLTMFYRAHRKVEHRLQMVGDSQTHSLPTSESGMARIAQMSGQSDIAAWRAELLHQLEQTDQLTEGFFAPNPSEVAPEITTQTKAIIDSWARYPALRSDRAQASFRRLRPGLLRSLMGAANPDEALVAFDGFLAGLPSGVQIFALFEANPQLVALIVDVVATAPVLASYLSRNAGVLDAVIGGTFFSDWPGVAGLRHSLDRAMEAVPDYEGKLDAARRWMKEWHFRIGVHHLRGLIDALGAGRQYADLATAVVTAVWPVVEAEFSRRHGPPPGRGAVVVGMGSLGAGLLNAGSDLDLIVIYDAQDIDISDGPRPLPTRTYFARLTQALVTALSVPMAEGRLYEVDMRLRPSGRQGPVATSFTSFREYQTNEAWTWEHLALTRARIMAGNASLGHEVEEFRRQLLLTKSTGENVLADVAEMRGRLAEAKPKSGDLDAKLGPGGLMDVELLGQTMALLTACPVQGIDAHLTAGVVAGKLSQTDQTLLWAGYTLLWQVQAGVRLLTNDGSDGNQIGKGGQEFLLRQTGDGDMATLRRRIETVTAGIAVVIDRCIGTSEKGAAC